MFSYLNNSLLRTWSPAFLTPLLRFRLHQGHRSLEGFWLVILSVTETLIVMSYSFSCVDFDPCQRQFTCNAIHCGLDCLCFGNQVISSASLTTLTYTQPSCKSLVSDAAGLWLCPTLMHDKHRSRNTFFMAGIITGHSKIKICTLIPINTHICVRPNTASVQTSKRWEEASLRWASIGPVQQQETSSQIKHLKIWVTGTHEYLMQLILCGRVTQWFEAGGEMLNASA